MRAYFIIAMIVVPLGLGPIWVLDPPLSTRNSDAEASYAAARFLSEPALAGHRVFDKRCAVCHGSTAEGQGDAPGLTDRAYAIDFRDSERLHGAVARDIPAHRDILGTSGASVSFNDLELMAKFLREIRVNRGSGG